MNELPSRIKVLGHWHEVKWLPKTQSLIDGDDNKELIDALGTVDTDMNIIAIRDESGQSRSQMRDSLLHEVIHVCFVHCGLRVGAMTHLRASHREEAIVRPLATALLLTLRDNPELTSFLLEEEE